MKPFRTLVLSRLYNHDDGAFVGEVRMLGDGREWLMVVDLTERFPSGRDVVTISYYDADTARDAFLGTVEAVAGDACFAVVRFPGLASALTDPALCEPATSARKG